MVCSRLLLMRHAKSSWKQPLVSDEHRPLNKRGRKSARAVAVELERLGLVPDLVLSSPSRRTRETWDLMAGTFRRSCGHRVEFFDSFYGEVFGRSAAPEILEALHEHVTAESEGAGVTVLVLGHNMGWELALKDLVGPRQWGSGLAMKTADCYVLEPAGSRGVGRDDVFGSYGRWSIERKIRSRDLLEEGG